MNTALNNRILRADGSMIVQPDDLEEMFLRQIPLDKLFVSVASPVVSRFNSMSDEQIQVLTDERIELSLDWKIPEDIKAINLDQFIHELCDDDDEIGAIRITNEYQEFKRRDLIMFLKTVIFIIDRFRRNNVIWGVGRGSSCASYLLFKLGLHSVNPLKYNIPYSEFFHD